MMMLVLVVMSDFVDKKISEFSVIKMSILLNHIKKLLPFYGQMGCYLNSPVG
jgi:hypothetical protein